MNKKLICPNCEKETLVEPLKEERKIDIKGEEFLVCVNHWRCLDCGEEIEDPDNPVDELDLAYREYRAKHQMFQPEQIRNLRDEYGLTQTELATILGWSPATISRYENGALQEGSHDTAVQSLYDPLYVFTLLEKRKEEFTEIRFHELKNRLNELILQKRNQHFIRALETRAADHYSGNRTFSIDKYISMVQYFVNICGGDIPKTKLNKLCFYVDFYHSKKYGTSLSGSCYTHEIYGPCPQHFQMLLGYMVESGFVEIEEYPVKKQDYSAELVKSKGHYEGGFLTEEEKETIDFVCKKLGSKNSSELSDLSHKEKAYKTTKLYELISYELAKYLSI